MICKTNALHDDLVDASDLLVQGRHQKVVVPPNRINLVKCIEKHTLTDTYQLVIINIVTLNGFVCHIQTHRISSDFGDTESGGKDPLRTNQGTCTPAYERGPTIPMTIPNGWSYMCWKALAILLMEMM